MHKPLDSDSQLLQNVLLPFLENLKQQTIAVLATDIDGKIIFLTKNLPRTTDDTTQQWLGKNYIDFIDSTNHIILTLNQLRQKAIDKKTVIFFTYATNNIGETETLPFPLFNGFWMPFFNSHNEVIAVYGVATPATPINMEHLLFSYNEEKLTQGSSLAIQLSPRQHEILFLLCFNISQSKISEYLGITRGTVSKIIMEQIMPKFDDVYNVESLVAKALEYGINYHIPISLVTPKVIELEPNLN